MHGCHEVLLAMVLQHSLHDVWHTMPCGAVSLCEMQAVPAMVLQQYHSVKYLGARQQPVPPLAGYSTPECGLLLLLGLPGKIHSDILNKPVSVRSAGR